jgi:hypothetical protein
LARTHWVTTTNFIPPGGTPEVSDLSWHENYLVKLNEAIWLGKCIGSYTRPQIKAIFEKELLKNPESRHAPAALIFRQRFDKYCSDKK